MPRVFDRFFRVKNQGNIPGTGLGLSIVKELVDAHGGHLAVVLDSGRRKRLCHLFGIAGGLTWKGSASILVVDDQPEILENLALVLELEGYKVLTARDGVEALAVLEAQTVDLILADIAMPRMNGYQLYERVREDPRSVAVPFVFLTARAMDSDIRYGKALGVDDYLTKPIQPEDLLASVRRSLAPGAAACPICRPNLPQRRSCASAVLDLGRLRIDLGQHRVWMDWPGGQTVGPRVFPAGLLGSTGRPGRTGPGIDPGHARAGH